jgi:ABC-type branched-subunit amino acid transport system substrate-binding protein
VFLGGRLDTGGAAVVRALRRRLGRDVTLLAPDGFTPLSLLVSQAGRAAATGTFVSLTGIADASELGPNGRRFARDLRAALGGPPVEPSAIYAAQAMEVALDAIARSDGTRASVRRALFATDLPGGLIGRVRFDANGDVSRSPVTILRVAPGARSGPAAPDAVVDRVLRVPADLVR